jgi:hypothetical protein
MKRLVAIVGCFAVSACTIQVPATAMSSDGIYMEGFARASMSEGKFYLASDAGDTCNGNYDPFNTALIISISVNCGPGKSGFVTVQRTPDLQSGTGRGKMSDGTIFISAFGDLAKTITRDTKFNAATQPETTGSGASAF